MTDSQKTSHGRSGRKPLGIRLFLLVVGSVLVVWLAWFFMRGTPYAPISHQGEQVPPAQALPSQSAPPEHRIAPVAPEQSTTLLKNQLQQVIAGMREANQKKDLSQLLSYYSPNFPGLPQRTQSISKAWKIYDYPKIEFEITDIKPLNDRAATARVTWNAEAKNISTQKSKNISKIYLIRFAKESGQWRIQALEDVK